MAYRFDCLTKRRWSGPSVRCLDSSRRVQRSAVWHQLSDRRSLQSLADWLSQLRLVFQLLNKVGEPFQHFCGFQVPHHRPESWRSGLHNIFLRLSRGTQKVSDHAGKAK